MGKTMITLTANQARAAANAVSICMGRTIDVAAQEWIKDTTLDDPELAAVFVRDPVDPKTALRRHQADYLADAALYDHLREIPHDAVRAADDFADYVQQSAHRILNSEAWAGRSMSAEQRTLALRDFGRV